jgi:hypothetical protein
MYSRKFCNCKKTAQKGREKHKRENSKKNSVRRFSPVYTLTDLHHDIEPHPVGCNFLRLELSG